MHCDCLDVQFDCRQALKLSWLRPNSCLQALVQSWFARWHACRCSAVQAALSPEIASPSSALERPSRGALTRQARWIMEQLERSKISSVLSYAQRIGFCAAKISKTRANFPRDHELCASEVRGANPHFLDGSRGLPQKNARTRAAQGLPCAIRSDRGSGHAAIPDTSTHAATRLWLCPGERGPRHAGATGIRSTPRTSGRFRGILSLR
jgi:hypothetical protein